MSSVRDDHAFGLHGGRDSTGRRNTPERRRIPLLLPETLDFDGPFPRLFRGLRLGVVGGGRISGIQATVARQADRRGIVAGALSSDPERTKAAAAEWTCPPADAFLTAEIDVLCELARPNAAGESDELMRLAEASGCVFGASYNMLCFAMIRQAREVGEAGGAGAISQIHANFMEDWMMHEYATDPPHVERRLDPANSGRTSCFGDIGVRASHLARFESNLYLTRTRAEF